MNGRRNFIKGFGVLSAVLAGTSVARTANAATAMASSNLHDDNSSVHCEAIDHLAPSGRANLTLVSDNTPPAPPAIASFGDGNISMDFYPKGYGQTMLCVGSSSFAPPKEQNSVALSVGKDNRLWIQVDGQWRRIALEG